MVDRNWSVANKLDSSQGNSSDCGGKTEGRKRQREDDGAGGPPVGNATAAQSEKRGCAEGLSWWTCLMLGVDQNMTQQQVVAKKN